MNAVEKLVAIEEIRRLKARYFRALDARDMSLFAALFTEDAEIDVEGSVDSESEGSAIEGFNDGAVIIGGKAMAEFVTRVASGITTAHHGHMAEIDITSDSTATGIWAMEDHLWFPAGAPHRKMHGYGHYHETYRKVAGQWLIDSMTITRLKVEFFD